MSSTLTETEIASLAADWYKKLDVHAPLVEILPLLVDEGLEMIFPEATVKGLAGFEGWYERVIRIFFDEVHTVKLVSSEINGDSAKVHVVVDWAASVWNPPNAKSERIMLDADQTWLVRKLPTTGKIVITSYTVNSLDYHPGSAKL
jgi:hypothetical protein